MTTHAGQAASQDHLDPVLEALLHEMIETESQSKAASRAEDAVTTAMAEALVVTLARTLSQASPYERSLMVAALAPALVTALNNMAASKKTGQESASGDGSDRQEGQ
jgi:hypothetical protein